MHSKIKLLVAAVMAMGALAALPALASATPVAHLPANTNFSISGGPGQLTGGASVDCQSVSGSGQFQNSTTGTIQFTFHGCKEGVLSTPCTTAGQPSGTIVTTQLTFHLVTITNGKPGVLVTSNNGHFASFHCAFGLISVNVTGNGVIGEITSPASGVPSKTFGVKFAGSGTAQNHTKVDGDATTYTLMSSLNGGTPAPAAEDAMGTGTWAAGGEGILTY